LMASSDLARGSLCKALRPAGWPIWQNGGDDVPAANPDIPGDARTRATVDLVRGAAMAGLAELYTGMDCTSADAASTARDQLADLLDARQLAATRRGRMRCSLRGRRYSRHDEPYAEVELKVRFRAHRTDSVVIASVDGLSFSVRRWSGALISLLTIARFLPCNCLGMMQSSHVVRCQNMTENEIVLCR